MKEITLTARRKAELSKALIEVMGEQMQDIDIANNLIVAEKTQEILMGLDVKASDFHSVDDAVDKVGLLKELSKMLSQSAGNYKKLKDERRSDRNERAQQTVTSDEHRQRLQDKMDRLLSNDDAA